MIQWVTGLCFFLSVGIAVEAAVTCPTNQTNLTQPEILPDPMNCSRFYICDNDRPFQQNCSVGLFFNPTLKVCDRQDNVVYCEYDDLIYLKPYCDCYHYVACDYGNMTVRECPKGHYFATDRVSDDTDPCKEGDCG